TVRANREAVCPGSRLKGQQNHPRLASGYLTPVISSQQLSLFHTLKVCKPRLHAEAIFLPNRMAGTHLDDANATARAPQLGAMAAQIGHVFSAQIASGNHGDPDDGFVMSH